MFNPSSPSFGTPPLQPKITPIVTIIHFQSLLLIQHLSFHLANNSIAFCCPYRLLPFLALPRGQRSTVHQVERICSNRLAFSQALLEYHHRLTSRDTAVVGMEIRVKGRMGECKAGIHDHLKGQRQMIQNGGIWDFPRLYLF
jgi:hypothetical protein